MIGDAGVGDVGAGARRHVAGVTTIVSLLLPPHRQWKGTTAFRVALQAAFAEAAATNGKPTAIIAHTVKEKPPLIEDLASEVVKLKGEGARREQLFQKSFEAEKAHGKVLEKKFDELFKRAKENPDVTPPKRDIDL